MTTETTTNQLPPCPLTGCEGGEHHCHEVEVYIAEEDKYHDCATHARNGYRCYSQHRPGLPEPGSLPEITDEMVERATSIFIGSSGYAAPGMRAALTGFRAELLAEGTRWQPIELDEIRAGMRIRATDEARGDRITTYTGVAHNERRSGDWYTEDDWLLTDSWSNTTIYEVDPATIPDPDADLIEKAAIAIYEGMQHPNWRAPLWEEIDAHGQERFLNAARATLSAIRAEEAGEQA